MYALLGDCVLDVWDSLRRRGRRLVRYWLDHIALPFATTVVGVAALVLLVNLAPSRLDAATGEKELYGWGNVALIVAIVVTALGVATLVTALQARHGETRAERVQRLTKALQEATQAIAEINTEMEDGARRLAELESQTEVQRDLANLSEREAAAVRDTLRRELGRERRRSLFRDLVMVLLGAVLSYVLTRF
jgi:uncharacterized membrane protein